MGKNDQQPSATGVYAALLTPRRPYSTEADCAILLDYLDLITRTGVDGVVLFGSTGEFVHFDTAERMRLAMLAIRRSRAPVLVNVSHSTLAGAIALAEHAITARAAGVLLMPPYFYRYTDTQIFEFYRHFVNSIGRAIPVYLYNLPFFTNPISAGLAERLFGLGAFAGIKDSSGDWQMFEALRSYRAARPFSLLVGHESVYLRAALAGADGIISGVAAALPELLVAMNRVIRSPAPEQAQRLNIRLQEFVAWIEKFPATTAIRRAAIARGWKLDHFALPLDEKTSQDLAAFERWFHNWLPSVLSECAADAHVRA
ncbi:MAG: dihydrodipicolinate synthase family protein [Acidobacteriaceae bacterium]|nr:dihydrodipicolinate synthase family protein [Acidobacteriaceae bacterium]